MRAVFTAADIPGENQIGGIIADEPLLAAGEVHYVGQPLALVVADTPRQARQALAAARVEIEELPPVLDPRAAAAQGLLIIPPRTFALGDVDAAWPACALVVEGRVDSGGQEHLYLETQAAVAVAGEKDTLRVISATQSPTVVQRTVARVLGLPMSQVSVEVFRLGGAFGGKEDQATAWAVLAALAARALRRPVKLVLNRQEDMRLTGKRHPYSSDFKIGLDGRGQDPGLRGDLLPERGRGGRPVDRHPRAHPVPRHQQLPRPQRPRHRHLLPHQPAALHRLPRLRRAAGHVRPGGGHLPGRRENGRRPGGAAGEEPARRGRRIPLRAEGEELPRPALLAGGGRRLRPCRRPRAGARLQRRPPPAQEGAGADAGLLRHLVHHHPPEPGRRPGPRLHRRQRLGLHRRRGDGPGGEQQGPAGRRAHPGRGAGAPAHGEHLHAPGGQHVADRRLDRRRPQRPGGRAGLRRDTRPPAEGGGRGAVAVDGVAGLDIRAGNRFP